MIPLNVKVGVILVIFAVSNLMSYFKGASVVQARFDLFKAEVSVIGQAQEAQTKRIIEQNETAKQEISDEYEKRLADLRSRYAVGVRQSNSAGSGNVSTPTKATRSADATATNDGLIVRCAETTLQLTELQRWVEKTR